MFPQSPFARLPTYKIILGVGLCTIGGAMLYSYFKNRDEDDDNNASDFWHYANEEAKSNKPDGIIITTFQIKSTSIPIIAGRQGRNIEQIEQTTDTHIRFRDNDDDENMKYCDISGLPKNVTDAKALILKEIERSPIVTEDFSVPVQIYSKIVGRCNETIKEISRSSQAKIGLDNAVNEGGNKRVITITGNQAQVNVARKLLEEFVNESEELQRSITDIEQNRDPRRSPTNSVNSSLYSSQTSLSSHPLYRDKCSANITEEKPIEVFVSAIASPSKFWVQLVGQQSRKLDEMVQTMTEYYSVEHNRNNHLIREPYVGQIVAAVFKYDGKWYRAEIVGIVPNKNKTSENLLDLFFVDYGDSEYVAPHDVYELRTDFLTLRFQAVECFLANVKSTRINSPNNWEIASIQLFEELTGVASWKKLISRVVTYKPRSISVPNSSTVREGTTIIGVELYDIVEGYEMNIGQYMVSENSALPALIDEDNKPSCSHIDTNANVAGNISKDAATALISNEASTGNGALKNLKNHNAVNENTNNTNGDTGSVNSREKAQKQVMQNFIKHEGSAGKQFRNFP
ncbi:tudor and KH domain-containing protein homolog [Teleopsis dalmanni]|uniref:tudor and KH domain-containing protein homolog n=1 Tax=Teleopsis dalmanni TaxID=139649 RepID=UPI0018CC7CFF|nr:tudor and KH domain-containing protein homolog [Teleopsis dalmanni]